jgi:hypothetical protein
LNLERKSKLRLFQFAGPADFAMTKALNFKIIDGKISQKTATFQLAKKNKV